MTQACRGAVCQAEETGRLSIQQDKGAQGACGHTPGLLARLLGQTAGPAGLLGLSAHERTERRMGFDMRGPCLERTERLFSAEA